jgi:hypothetical protein
MNIKAGTQMHLRLHTTECTYYLNFQVTQTCILIIFILQSTREQYSALQNTKLQCVDASDDDRVWPKQVVLTTKTNEYNVIVWKSHSCLNSEQMFLKSE